MTATGSTRAIEKQVGFSGYHSAKPELSTQRERDQGLPALPGRALQFVDQGGLQVVRVHLYLTGYDLRVARAMEAQLAHAHRIAAATHGRAENAARHGPRAVEIAGAG